MMGNLRRANHRRRFSSVCTENPRSGDVSDSGTSLAEFALILPVLILILFGIIEFGIAFNRAQAVEAAAREGGRLASLGSSTQADVDARVNAALAGIPMQNAVVVSPIVPCAGRMGQSVTVTVSTVHNLSIPLVSLPALNLQSQAIFRCEAGN